MLVFKSEISVTGKPSDFKRIKLIFLDKYRINSQNILYFIS